MTGIVKEDKEFAGHLVFLVLMTDCVKDGKECAGHLVFLFLITGSAKEAKECTGHLVFLFLLTGYRSSRHCLYFFSKKVIRTNTENSAELGLLVSSLI